ncbi:RRQRL motif-containing zinc-binding protein, partial [Streptomyces sp. NPDC006324]|uniref:RRQRL motif-containing zinc-binding protein n=1 Tax=Streptomyces sp. NPDC006324 TaxID=3156751 RepID=UPI0033B371E8
RPSSCSSCGCCTPATSRSALYRIDQAKPVRPMTPAKRAALERANAARRVCPECGRDAGYRIPPSLGMCVPCGYPDTAPVV